jgi:RimJ/RimL family protein N-acetyltransferase
MPEFRLATERLILRDWRDADREPFAEMNADPDVMRHLDGPAGRAASDALIERLMEGAARHGHTCWALERKSDGAFIGFCGVRRGGHAGTPVPDELEIGWRLMRSAWGQGYAREAAQASLDWGWANTDEKRIVAWTVKANKASWGLMVRLGMTHRPELDFNHPAFEDGHPLHRHVVYAIARPQ